MKKTKKQLKTILIAGFLGAFVALVCWLFFVVMGVGLNLLWTVLPSKIYLSCFPIVICVIGGFVIGVCRKKYGDYPYDKEKVLLKIKSQEQLEYKQLPKLALCSLLPLIFGGSVGPEAALTQIIGTLCTWIGNKFKYIGKEVKDISQIGYAATLGIIFRSPLYGFVDAVEDPKEKAVIKMPSKIIIYFVTILAGFGTFFLLQNIYNGLGGLGHFTELTITSHERIWLVPLSIVGVLAGYFYYLTNKLTHYAVNPIKKYPIIQGVMGGLLLGIFGVLLPLTLFSGEGEMKDLVLTWKTMSVAALFIVGFGKLLVTNICLNTGWKGGNIFPIVFAGISIGYACAKLLSIDPVYAIIVVTASLASCVMKKPLAVVLLLIVCFPVEGIIPMLFATTIGCIFPLPKIIMKN